MQRFVASIERDNNGCWLWTSTLNSRGYARISIRNKMVLAHRWIWMRWNGPIPDDLVVDHLCEVKRCVNPDHMQLLTSQENIRRSCPLKTHCPRGHELDIVGFYLDRSNGARKCKVCHLERTNARYHRMQQAKKLSLAAQTR